MNPRLTAAVDAIEGLMRLHGNNLTPVHILREQITVLETELGRERAQTAVRQAMRDHRPGVEWPVENHDLAGPARGQWDPTPDTPDTRTLWVKPNVALDDRIEQAIAKVATGGTIVCTLCNASDVTDADHRPFCPVWDLRRVIHETLDRWQERFRAEHDTRARLENGVRAFVSNWEPHHYPQLRQLLPEHEGVFDGLTTCERCHHVKGTAVTEHVDGHGEGWKCRWCNWWNWQEDKT